jgi:valyl-tRNA synthetase
MNLEGVELKPLEHLKLDATDKWMLTKLNRAVQEVSDNIEAFELGLAATKVYDFIWSDFCDWYIELTKSRLYGQDAAEKQTAASVLVTVLRTALKLLHPFMPYVTEAIWKHLPGEVGSIMRSTWPKLAEIPVSQADEEAVEKTKEIITAVRTIRSDMKVPPNKKPALKLATGIEDELAGLKRYILALAGLSSMEFLPEGSAAPKGSVSAVCGSGMLYLPLGELVDIAQEIARSEKEQATLQRDFDSITAKLSNAGFLAKAPAEVVESEKQRLAAIREKMDRIAERIKGLKEIK